MVYDKWYMINKMVDNEQTKELTSASLPMLQESKAGQPLAETNDTIIPACLSYF